MREILTGRGQLEAAGRLGQSHSGLLEEDMVGRGHANEEYITAYRFVN
jgi:hypothetical protein